MASDIYTGGLLLQFGLDKKRLDGIESELSKFAKKVGRTFEEATDGISRKGRGRGRGEFGKFEELTKQFEKLRVKARQVADALGIDRSTINSYQDIIGLMQQDERAAAKLSSTLLNQAEALEAAGRGSLALGDDLKEIRKETLQTGDTITKLVGKVTQWLTATAIVFAVIRAFEDMRRVLLEVDSAAADLQKVLGDETGVAALLRDARDAAAEYGGSIAEVLQIQRDWARQYKDVNDVQELSRVSLTALNIAELTVEASTRLLTSTIRQWGFETKDAITVLDVWNELSNQAGVSTLAVAEATSRASSAFRNAGATLQELAGLSATTIKVTGRTGEQVGTLLRTIAAFSVRPETISSLNEVGIHVERLHGRLLGVMDILQQAAARWDSLTDVERRNVAMSLGATRRFSELQAILMNWDQVLVDVGTAWDSVGSSMRENQTFMRSIERQQERLRGSTQALVVQFAGATGLTNAIQAATTVSANAVKSFSEWPGILTRIGVSIGLMGLTAFTVSLKRVAFEITAVRAAATKLWTALIALDPVVLGIIAAVGVLSFALMSFASNADRTANRVENLRSAIEELNDTNDAAVGVIQNNVDKLEFYRDRLDLLKKAVDEGKDVEDALNKTREASRKLVQGLGTDLPVEGKEREALTKQIHLQNAALEVQIALYRARAREQLVAARATLAETQASADQAKSLKESLGKVSRRLESYGVTEEMAMGAQGVVAPMSMLTTPAMPAVVEDTAVLPDGRVAHGRVARAILAYKSLTSRISGLKESYDQYLSALESVRILEEAIAKDTEDFRRKGVGEPPSDTAPALTAYEGLFRFPADISAAQRKGIITAAEQETRKSAREEIAAIESLLEALSERSDVTDSKAAEFRQKLVNDREKLLAAAEGKVVTAIGGPGVPGGVRAKASLSALQRQLDDFRRASTASGRAERQAARSRFEIVKADRDITKETVIRLMNEAARESRDELEELRKKADEVYGAGSKEAKALEDRLVGQYLTPMGVFAEGSLVDNWWAMNPAIARKKLSEQLASRREQAREQERQRKEMARLDDKRADDILKYFEGLDSDSKKLESAAQKVRESLGKVTSALIPSPTFASETERKLYESDKAISAALEKIRKSFRDRLTEIKSIAAAQRKEADRLGLSTEQIDARARLAAEGALEMHVAAAGAIRSAGAAQRGQIFGDAAKEETARLLKDRWKEAEKRGREFGKQLLDQAGDVQRFLDKLARSNAAIIKDTEKARTAVAKIGKSAGEKELMDLEAQLKERVALVQAGLADENVVREWYTARKEQIHRESEERIRRESAETFKRIKEELADSLADSLANASSFSDSMKRIWRSLAAEIIRQQIVQSPVFNRLASGVFRAETGQSYSAATGRAAGGGTYFAATLNPMHMAMLAAMSAAGRDRHGVTPSGYSALTAGQVARARNARLARTPVDARIVDENGRPLPLQSKIGGSKTPGQLLAAYGIYQAGDPLGGAITGYALTSTLGGGIIGGLLGLFGSKRRKRREAAARAAAEAERKRQERLQRQVLAPYDVAFQGVQFLPESALFGGRGNALSGRQGGVSNSNFVSTVHIDTVRVEVAGSPRDAGRQFVSGMQDQAAANNLRFSSSRGISRSSTPSPF